MTGECLLGAARGGKARGPTGCVPAEGGRRAGSLRAPMPLPLPAKLVARLFGLPAAGRALGVPCCMTQLVQLWLGERALVPAMIAAAQVAHVPVPVWTLSPRQLIAAYAGAIVEMAAGACEPVTVHPVVPEAHPLLVLGQDPLR